MTSAAALSLTAWPRVQRALEDPGLLQCSCTSSAYRRASQVGVGSWLRVQMGGGLSFAFGQEAEGRSRPYLYHHVTWAYRGLLRLCIAPFNFPGLQFLEAC